MFSKDWIITFSGPEKLYLLNHWNNRLLMRFNSLPHLGEKNMSDPAGTLHACLTPHKLGGGTSSSLLWHLQGYFLECDKATEDIIQLLGGEALPMTLPMTNKLTSLKSVTSPLKCQGSLLNIANESWVAQCSIRAQVLRRDTGHMWVKPD